MRTRFALPLLLLSAAVAVPACRRKPALAPLQLPPLSAAPAEQVTSNLIKAHYDPLELGLAELVFELDLDYPRVKTKLVATGTWRKGQSVAIKIKAVEREGRTETKPSDPGMGTQVWTALQYQSEHLLEGIGRGFLRDRMEHWQKLKGQSRLEGDRLLLTFSEPSGETLVTIGKGWAIEKVENRSPKKVVRWMEYQHRDEKGRNLITMARMHVTIDKTANLPPGEVKLVQSQEGLTFNIEYQEAGGYLLPSLLRKTSSRGEEVLMKLRYTMVK